MNSLKYYVEKVLWFTHLFVKSHPSIDVDPPLYLDDDHRLHNPPSYEKNAHRFDDRKFSPKNGYAIDFWYAIPGKVEILPKFELPKL